LVTLAGLLSERSLFHSSCLYFYGKSAPLIEDFVGGVERFPNSAARVSTHRDGTMEVRVGMGQDPLLKQGNRPWNQSQDGGSLALATSVRCGAYQWAQQLGLVGKRASEKRIPPDVLLLCDDDVALFLGRLWSGDGFVSTAEHPGPYYATSSELLAVDVQHLLLRLGIVSELHEKRHPHHGGSRADFTVHVVGEDGARRFLGRITPHCVGRELQVEQFRKFLELPKGGTSKDALPTGIRKWVDEERRKRGLTWHQVERCSGVSTKEFTGNGSALNEGVRRSTVLKLGDFFDSRRLREAACSDVFWDRIVSIESKGMAETYDLTVDDDHNFVADGLIVHNSHSAAYGIISYQTAYLKAKWPVEYMAAGMSVAMGDTDKLASYIEECRQLGIEVLPPDINTSDLDFTVTEKKIRFGLGAVKGAGEKAIQSIVEARAKGGRFESIFQFCERIDSKYVDKKVVEQLVRCGAFDSTGGHRAQVMEALEEALRMAGVKQADRRAGQLSIFGEGGGGPNGKAELPDIPPWPQESLLVFEREVLGCYVTSNPLLRYEEILKTLSTATVDRMADFEDGTEVTMGGMISGLRAMITKTGKNAGQKYVMFKFADLTGSTEAVCFASDFEKNREHLLNDAIVFCAGRIGFREDNPSLRVSLVTPMEKAREMLAGSVRLAVSSTGLEEDLIRQVQDIMKSHPGPCPVFFEVEVPGGRKVLVKTANEHFVSPSERFFADIEGVLGTGHVRLAGKPTR
jgi:DNA polymerase-3 subunit alpha